MRSIIAWSMQLRLLVLTGAAVLMFFGITQLREMPVDVLPEFSRPHVEIQTEALGLSAAGVEAMITVPLEADMLNGVSWVDEIRSESIPGLSSIVLFFEPGTEMLTARQMVQERLVGVHALPQVSKPPAMLQPVSSSNRFMTVGMTSDARSLIEMSVLARWTIVPRLRGLPGVANVSIWGQRKRQLQVQVDPERLRDEGVTLHQIIETAGNALWVSPLSYLNASTPGTGGWIETPNQRLGIQHVLPISTPADLAKVTVEGTSMRLGELASVVEDHQPLIGNALVHDDPALMLVVEKFPWANTVEVTQSVEDALAALQPGLSGVKIDSAVFRPATYLELVADNLSRAALFGVALVAVALLTLLFNWRTALISLVAVLISALAAVAVLYLRGVTINAMVIAGLMIALVALIDDAVIDIQNIARRLRGQRAGDGADGSAGTIFEASLAMRRPLVYATLIVALAVLPLFLLDGLAGAFSRPIALSYGLALLASFATALTVTPALSLLLFPTAGPSGGESPVLEGLRSACAGGLSRSSRAPGRVFLTGLVALGILAAGALWAMPKDGETVIPKFREMDVVVTLDGPSGTSLPAMRRMAARVSSDLQSIDGVRAVSAHVGRAVMSDKVSDINGGEVWVSIDRSAAYDETVAAIRDAVADYSGFDIDVDTYLSERIKDEMVTDDDLVVRVYGEDMAMLRRKADEVGRVMGRVDGIASSAVQYPKQHPNLEIEVDLAAAQQYGLKPGDVRRAAATLLSGIEVGSLFEEQKVFEVVVWGTPELRHSLSSVDQLLIDTPMGGHVRLGEVAELRMKSAPTVITREAVARYMDVSAHVQGREVSAVAADVEEQIRKEIEFPLEYRAELLGSHAAALASANRVRGFSIAAVIGIFLLLQSAFGSWSLAFFVFCSLPISLLGGVAAAFAFGEVSSLGSMLGLLAIFALAVRTAMVTVGHYRELEKNEGGAFSAELVERGTRERFAPIVTSALVTAVAFLPVVLFGNVAGYEIMHPMAIVVVGGLISSTLVNLLVIPSLYLGFRASADPLELASEEEAA